jgi:hypothetical protein
MITIVPEDRSESEKSLRSTQKRRDKADHLQGKRSHKNRHILLNLTALKVRCMLNCFSELHHSLRTVLGRALTTVNHLTRLPLDPLDELSVFPQFLHPHRSFLRTSPLFSELSFCFLRLVADEALDVRFLGCRLALTAQQKACIAIGALNGERLFDAQNGIRTKPFSSAPLHGRCMCFIFASFVSIPSFSDHNTTCLAPFLRAPRGVRGMFFMSCATRATSGSAFSRFKVRLIAAGARHNVEKRDWRYLDGV